MKTKRFLITCLKSHTGLICWSLDFSPGSLASEPISKPLCFAASRIEYWIHQTLFLFLQPMVQIWIFYFYLEKLLCGVLGWKDIFLFLIHGGLYFLRVPEELIIVVSVSSGIPEIPFLKSNIFITCFSIQYSVIYEIELSYQKLYAYLKFTFHIRDDLQRKWVNCKILQN